MGGPCVDVLKRVKSLIGRYTDVIQSLLVGCDGRPGSFPTMHVLCRLRSRSPNDLPTTWQDFLTLYPRLLFIPDHSVQNNREQSGTPRPSSPTSQDLSRPIPVLSRLPYDSTRPLPTIKVGKGRLSGRLSVTGALSTYYNTILKKRVMQNKLCVYQTILSNITQSQQCLLSNVISMSYFESDHDGCCCFRDNHVPLLALT